MRASVIKAIASLWLLAGCAACPGIGDTMRMMGYTELRPPSTLLGPGAMVYVKSTSPFQAGTVCGVRASMGKRFVPNTSPTAAKQLKVARGKSFQLDAEVLEYIHAEAKFSALKTITVSLTNARITELTDDMVAENVANRSQACSEMIAERERAGFKVTMISSAIEGDVVYSVTWKEESKLEAAAKIETLSQLALSLGATADCVGTSTISAKGLIWGIIDDRWLAARSAPEQIAESVRPGTRVIGPEHLGHIMPKPDAPIVASEHPYNAHYRLADELAEDKQDAAFDRNKPLPDIPMYDDADAVE